MELRAVSDVTHTALPFTLILTIQSIEPMIKVIASGWERYWLTTACRTSSWRLPTVLASFIRAAASTIRAFYREVSSRAVKVGVGLAGLQMLQQQLGVYESLLKVLMNMVKGVINACQKDACQKDINREFRPIVADHMIPAHEGCAQEFGKRYTRIDTRT